jgi:DNA-binding MarR family transcriptional regulator
MLRTPVAAEADESKPTVDSPKAVVRALADVLSLAEPRLVDLWRSTGMTFAQRRVLRRLRQGPRAAGSLAAELGIAAPTLTRQLQRLEGAGLLKRSVDNGDRRKVLVSLTRTGESSLAEHGVFRDSPLALAAEQLTPRQRRVLVGGLGRLVRLARNHELGRQ